MIAIVFGFFMTVLVIVFHYWGLSINTTLSRKIDSHFATSVFSVCLIFVIHLIEIIAYGVHLYIAVHYFGWQGFADGFTGGALTYFHMAASTYTTLGMLDPTPVERIAVLLDINALTGFMMLTWSATYYYNIFSGSGKTNPSKKDD